MPSLKSIAVVVKILGRGQKITKSKNLVHIFLSDLLLERSHGDSVKN